MGKRRGSGVGGLNEDPTKASEDGGRSAPTRAAPPRPAPSPARPASSLASSTAFILFLQPPPSSKEHRHNTSFLSPHPSSTPALLPGCAGLPRPPPRLGRPTAGEDTAASSPRIRLFSFLSSFLLASPSSPRGASASQRGQPRNQRWRLQEGQLETVLKRLNFPPKFILELNQPRFSSARSPLLFSESG